MHTFRRSLRAAPLAFAVFSVVAIHTAGAQSSCAPVSGALQPLPADIPEVLRRPVSVRAEGVALREALDRIAAAGRVRLSYSAELLDLTRRVCLNYESATIAQVLANLFDARSVKPVVVGTDQIVLAPADTPKPEQATRQLGLMREVGQLDRVVVTGSTTGGSQRSLPIALDVVGERHLSQRGAASLSGALDGVVPGLWMWEQSPLSLLARYGSIRGASSFGVSHPKVYVDGIEAANSLLMTHLDPDVVSRIEVIRGPQGAALYGADAISGVMNIVTRQEGTEDGSARAEIISRGGASSSDYASGSVLSQTHAASLRIGSRSRSARIGAAMTRIGAFVPDAFSRQVTTNAGGRIAGSRGVVTGTFRLFAQDAQAPLSPFLSGLGQSGATPPTFTNGDSTGRQTVRQYTVGGSGTFVQSERWTHSATVGLDGYRLSSTALGFGAFPSPTDSALRAAAGSAIRSTLRLSSTGYVGDREALSGNLTIAAEHSVIRDRTLTESYAGSSEGVTSRRYVETRSNAGVVAQLGAGYREIVHATGGLRIERNTGLDGIGEIAMLPMFGISVIQPIGFATLKVRSAYGRGIRAPETSTRSRMLLSPRGALGDPLAPEEQSGIEVGADLFMGAALSLHVTRFDQTASGLIQPVSVTPVTLSGAAPATGYIAYQLQNVGVITNRGWELQTAFNSGHWSGAATYSQVDSRVRRLASRYTGDLRPGDRMLEVPARTLGVNAGYERGRWSASWSLSRASDWINYDRLAMLRAIGNEDRDAADFVGPELRSWWRTYDGVTRVGGRLAVAATRGVTLSIEGENLLDEQRGEPDNITVLPGRTLSAGVRLNF